MNAVVLEESLPKTPSTIYPEAQTHDPIDAKSHTLSNGLKIFMSVNKNEPRVYTNIVVRAGSKQDPAETTGLAHYLEHMMFKGTSRIAALDWEAEKQRLTQIADLYEQHRRETDPSVRARIYAQIDAISNEAARYVAANEYDKLVSSLGAKNTNAYTNNESTVYVNDVPTNELERWFRLESERFKMVVLRLFHTELETVYEEFNIGQDEDGRKVYYAMMSGLFPNHPYGTQTTIGKGEHLKNPSHYNILKYFETYYVPNNMALVLSGDFDPAQVVALAETYFGNYTPRTIPPFTFDAQPALRGIQKIEVLGQQAPYVQLAWRLGGANTLDSDLSGMIAAMLYNQQAGLIDLDLIQQQKVLSASAGAMNLADYAAIVMSGRPREGQSLEAVEQALIEQMSRIKSGDFPDWLMSAVVKDMKYSITKNFENNQSRVGAMTDAFVKGIDWATYITRVERLKKLTKNDIVSFANRHFNDNYVVIYKRTGEDKGVLKVDKPAITPVTLNRTDKSEFAKAFFAEESPRLKPDFIDFKKAIQTHTLAAGVPVDYIHNTTNETFSLYYIFEMGKWADKMAALALNYLPFLGTDKYSAAELQQEFYKLGLSFDVFSNDERSYVVLNGLDESFTEGVRLFEHILHNVQGNATALNNMVADILARRDNQKKDKRTILRSAMADYAKYGAVNPFNDIVPKEALEKVKPADLVQKIRELTQFEHRIFYYGTKSPDEVTSILNAEHKLPQKLRKLTPNRVYPELDMTENSVYFVHFPMVQSEILMISKGTPQYAQEEQIWAGFYNNYFGAGLSSIVFQEIREARALAYSANAFYSTPTKKERAHYLNAYVGTQPDKLKEAITAMRDIIENMPISEAQIEHAKQAVLKNIESERITKANVYWTYKGNLDRGIDYDMRQDTYALIQSADVAELKAFQSRHVKGRHFTFLVMGDRSKIDFAFLNSIGNVTELSLETLFGY